MSDDEREFTERYPFTMNMARVEYLTISLRAILETFRWDEWQLSTMESVLISKARQTLRSYGTPPDYRKRLPRVVAEADPLDTGLSVALGIAAALVAHRSPPPNIIPPVRNEEGRWSFELIRHGDTHDLWWGKTATAAVESFIRWEIASLDLARPEGVTPYAGGDDGRRE